MPNISAVHRLQIPAGTSVELKSLRGGDSAKFTVDEFLNAGGMGSVYVGKDGSGRRVALKFMTAPQGEDSVSGFHSRLMKEHERQRDLLDEGVKVIPPYAAGSVTLSGAVWYVLAMRFLPEARALGKGQGLPQRIVELKKALEAVSEFHEHGRAVHRDLKPENLLFSENRVWIADLGLASARPMARADSGSTVNLSMLVGVGTLPYMAPEQIVGTSDHLRHPRVDVYAMGCMTYELVFGRYARRPVQSSPPLDVLHYIESGVRADPPRANLPREYFRESEVGAVETHLLDALREAMDLDWSHRALSLSNLLKALEAVDHAIRPEMRVVSASLSSGEEVDGEDSGGVEFTDPDVDALFAPGQLVTVNDAPLPAAKGGTEDPFRWQDEALTAWRKNSRTGIIEAVTGSGKSHVGANAVREHLDNGGKAVVVVPSRPLVKQWADLLEAQLPGRRVGRMGGGASDRFSSKDVIVTTVQSFSNLRVPTGALLVADECHRYGGAEEENGERVMGTWASEMMRPKWGARMGLSATVERSDDGHHDVLPTLLGPVVFTLDLKRAVADNVIAPFRIAFLKCSFAPREQERYDVLCEELTRLHRTLLRAGASADSFGMFMKSVERLRESGVGGVAAAAATWLKLFNERRDLLADGSSKLAAVTRLFPCIWAADRTLIFTNYVATGTMVFGALERADIPAAYIDGKNFGLEGRTTKLRKFKSGHYRAIVTPKVLDEGIDVPIADLGIALASSRSKRQMIQRLGRVVRRKSDGRFARFVFLVIKGTVEDPDQHAADEGGFLSSLLDAVPKDRIKTFDESASDDAVRWINELHPSPTGSEGRQNIPLGQQGGPQLKEAKQPMKPEVKAPLQPNPPEVGLVDEDSTSELISALGSGDPQRADWAKQKLNEVGQPVKPEANAPLQPNTLEVGLVDDDSPSGWVSALRSGDPQRAVWAIQKLRWRGFTQFGDGKVLLAKFASLGGLKALASLDQSLPQVPEELDSQRTQALQALADMIRLECFQWRALMDADPALVPVLMSTVARLCAFESVGIRGHAWAACESLLVKWDGGSHVRHSNSSSLISALVAAVGLNALWRGRIGVQSGSVLGVAAAIGATSDELERSVRVIPIVGDLLSTVPPCLGWFGPATTRDIGDALVPEWNRFSRQIRDVLSRNLTTGYGAITSSSAYPIPSDRIRPVMEYCSSPEFDERDRAGLLAELLGLWRSLLTPGLTSQRSYLIKTYFYDPDSPEQLWALLDHHRHLVSRYAAVRTELQKLCDALAGELSGRPSTDRNEAVRIARAFRGKVVKLGILGRG